MKFSFQGETGGLLRSLARSSGKTAEKVVDDVLIVAGQYVDNRLGGNYLETRDELPLFRNSHRSKIDKLVELYLPLQAVEPDDKHEISLSANDTPDLDKVVGYHHCTSSTEAVRRSLGFFLNLVRRKEAAVENERSIEYRFVSEEPKESVEWWL